MKKLRLSRAKQRTGFTLIELMIVVAIIGILASIALPAFRTVLFRSRTAEVSGNLSAMFKNAAAYYNAERADKGQSGGMSAHCTVADAGPLPSNPQSQKQRFLDTSANFRALGFSVADYVYFGYGLRTETGLDTCNGAANDSTVYTLFANGDLDSDTITSSFEMAVGSDSNNELYHSRGLFIQNELE